MSLYEAQVIPYGKLHTVLVTHVSGRYLPARRGTERSAGRLGKWMWDIWLFSLTRDRWLGMQLREAAWGKETWTKITDNTDAESMHTRWSRVNLGCKENELQKLCSSGKGFQAELSGRKLITSQDEQWVFKKGWPSKVT